MTTGSFDALVDAVCQLLARPNSYRGRCLSSSSTTGYSHPTGGTSATVGGAHEFLRNMFDKRTREDISQKQSAKIYIILTKKVLRFVLADSSLQ